MKRCGLLLLLLASSSCHDPETLTQPAPDAGRVIEEQPTPTRPLLPSIIDEPFDQPEVVAQPNMERPDAGEMEQPGPPAPLELTFLGVGGFAMRYKDDLVLSAPLYSNPPLNDVLGGSIHSDHAAIDRFLTMPLEDTKAIITGHAHYDHLLDVPYVLSKTPNALIYGNTSVQHVLDALAPNPSPTCTAAMGSEPSIARDRVIALDDPNNDRVDYRLCASAESNCAGTWDGRAGEYVAVPNSKVRLRAVCSAHPDQFLIFHFGIGCVSEEQCTLPMSGNDWREGATIAFLIDFLDERTGEPIYRIYYQDAPTNAPVGNVHPDVLAEKRVDVALLCVGNYDQVNDHPSEIIAAMNPRYVVSGHWENFFKKQDEGFEDIPFLDVDAYRTRLTDAMPATGEAPVKVNGQTQNDRRWTPDPGTRFEFSAESAHQ